MPKKDGSNGNGGGKGKGGPKNDTTAPLFVGPTFVGIEENQTIVSDFDADEQVTWSLLGSDDDALFDVDADTGVVTFKVAPDFEAPVGDDQIYVFTLSLVDAAGNTTTQTVTVEVTDVFEDVTAPSISGPAAIAVNEGQTIVADFDANEVVTWSLVAGDDAEHFKIDPVSGEVTFRSAPDYEAASDQNGDNLYEVTVQATDGSGNSSALAVTVLVENVAPVISGPGSVSVDENQTAVTQYTADEPGSWAIGAGADGALFDIDPVTGVLSFATAPDFEAPVDADADNTYDLTVLFTDAGGAGASRSVAVTVADVGDTPDPGGPSKIVIFGDSLSDNGNFSALASDFMIRDANGELMYSVPFQYDGGGSIRTYDDRAFTDGTPYADTLARLMSLDASYENFAFGGAQVMDQKLAGAYITEYSNLAYTRLDGTTGTFSIVEDTQVAMAALGDFDINLAAQVQRYVDLNPGGAAPGTLAVINIGANDLGEFDTSFFNILLGGVNDFAADLGREIEAQARLLAGLGVDEVALATLPDARFFVGYDRLNWLEQPVARDLIDSVNDQVLHRANLLNADGIDTQVIRQDIFSNELRTDMQAYGFLYKGPYLYGYSGDPTWIEIAPGVIEPVFDVNTAALAYREEQILFFDEIHPSGAMHDMLAIFAHESLSTEEVFGGGGADVLAGTGMDDFVVARAGDDVVTLAGGDDVAHGGRGADLLEGGEGSDLLVGGSGNDSLDGGAGSDVLAGSGGADDLAGGDGDDMLIGGLGSDVATGGAGADVFIFIDEALWGGAGGSTDHYDGGDDVDTLLVFLAEGQTVDQAVTGTTTTLTFGDGATLTAENMEDLVLHYGLPDDADSPILLLGLSGDLLARYEEAELWGVV